MNIEKLAEELETMWEVSFTSHNLHYNIYWSEGSDGWMVDVFELKGDEPIDGGLCTGSAKDAVEFML